MKRILPFPGQQRAQMKITRMVLGRSHSFEKYTSVRVEMEWHGDINEEIDIQQGMDRVNEELVRFYKSDLGVSTLPPSSEQEEGESVPATLPSRQGRTRGDAVNSPLPHSDKTSTVEPIVQEDAETGQTMMCTVDDTNPPVTRKTGDESIAAQGNPSEGMEEIKSKFITLFMSKSKTMGQKEKDTLLTRLFGQDDFTFPNLYDSNMTAERLQKAINGLRKI